MSRAINHARQSLVCISLKRLPLYIYGVQRIDSVNNFTASGDQATVDVVVTEERTLYNNQGKIDQKNSGLSTLLVRYNLENDEGTWKIANSRTLKSLVRR